MGIFGCYFQAFSDLLSLNSFETKLKYSVPETNAILIIDSQVWSLGTATVEKKIPLVFVLEQQRTILNFICILK